MKICLIDLEHPIEGFANRDQTGGFGSKMLSQGVIGKLLANLKKDRIRIPLITFAYMSAIAKQYRHECKISSEAKDEADLIIIATSMIHWEYEVEAEVTHEFIRKKSNGHAYSPIFASGANACILHYINNNQIFSEIFF